MSIIQDALKKVQGPEAKPIPEFAASGKYKEKARPNSPLRVPLFIIFLLLLIITVRGFWLQHGPNVNDNGALLKTKYGDISSFQNAVLAEPYSKPLSKEKTVKNFPDFLLSGTMQLIDGPRAIINNVIVGVGDTINGAAVTRISKDGVTLKYKESEVALKMEEER